MKSTTVFFIDWSDMDKEGAVCAEQMLYLQSLRSMSEVTKLLYGNDRGYADKAEQLKEKIQKFYWREEKGAYIDSYTSGRENVTRHANIFAVMFGIADAAQTRAIVSNVLLNDSVTQITTPYFKFFELDVLCGLGYLETATQRMEDYWGGMLLLGATTVWEQYDPAETGTEHYAMYGMKYGRSLCHAWGAGPVFLLSCPKPDGRRSRVHIQDSGNCPFRRLRRTCSTEGVWSEYAARISSGALSMTKPYFTVDSISRSL